MKKTHGTGMKFAILALGFCLVFFGSFWVGRYDVSPMQTLRILLDWLLRTVSRGRLFLIQTWQAREQAVVINVRLPRVAAAALVGAALSTAGCSYQGMFRNPMVSPDLLGASTGAGFGAALGLLFGLGYGAITGLSFGFGLLAVLLAYLISRVSKIQTTLAMVLAGVMISSLFTSGTSFIKLVADPTDQLPAITYWLMGSLTSIKARDVQFAVLPILVGLIPLWLLRWRVGSEVSVSQTAFLFAVSGVMTAVCSLLSVVLNARAEVGNDAPACLVSTSLLKLGLSAVLCIIFWFTAVQWSRWLLREYRGEAFWQSAWPLPTIYAAFLVFCMPLDPAVVLINRLMIISVLAVTISLLGIFLLLYEMYQVAREYTRSAQLDRENQLLAVESRRYTELRTYMEQTRHLRHDFRQHLHVIAGLTEAGQVDELKNYLHQYESELSEERPTLCANPAVDALAGHYDHEAHSLGVPVDWRLELPRQLAIPEADFCMMLGNLLENAFHASQKLPPEQRQVKVLARMLSPAMLGLLVENRYDGVLKRQQGILHSTKHDGMGIGLVSIQTAVSRYGGSMTVETENGLFRVNILLNL